MADAVTATYLLNGYGARKEIHLTNISDGTGETTVIKVDISTLTFNGGLVPTYTTVKRIDYNIQGMTSVRLLWDHNTDDIIDVLPANSGSVDFFAYGGKTDPKSTGGTGDIILTTNGAISGGSYDITIQFVCHV